MAIAQPSNKRTNKVITQLVPGSHAAVLERGQRTCDLNWQQYANCGLLT
jgi:hypothetical protein